MVRTRPFLTSAICGLFLATWSNALVAEREGEFSEAFEGTARLVFKAHCFHCHGESAVVEGGLDLRLRRLIVEGGDSGAAIAPFEPGKSYLLDRMVSGEMPPEEVAVRPSEKEIEIVRRWIREGARTARPEPQDPDELPRITPEERSFWAFQPIETPPPPDLKEDAHRVRTPIDAFILRRLRRAGRGFSPDADRRTLIRRATFDLIGLPPTGEDVEAFVNDESDDAWSRQNVTGWPEWPSRDGVTRLTSVVHGCLMGVRPAKNGCVVGII